VSTNPNQLTGDVQVSGSLQVENPSGSLQVPPEYVLTVTAQADPSPFPPHPAKGPAAAIYATGGHASILASNGPSIAVQGTSTNGTAVVGISTGESGVAGAGTGVQGASTYGTGVAGQSTSGVGVSGTSTNQVGVQGSSQGWDGVSGTATSNQHSGVFGGHSGAGNGVAGHSNTGYGVDAYSASGTALHSRSDGGGLAAVIDGTLQVNGNHNCTGTLTVDVDIILTNSSQDCAEEFDLSSAADGAPGTVMVLGHAGCLEPCERAYDRRAAGVISGAGDLHPGLVLGRQQGHGGQRAPIALMGKVFCWIDADYAPVEVGDLLTTSPTPGHAMKATDPSRAFGAVLGKALADVPAGKVQAPILVVLQ
jgi:hypothetical protein